jgi:hypothetical protein
MPLQIGVFLVTFVGAPVALYHGVEEPVIRVGKRVAKRLTGPAGRTSTPPYDPEPELAADSPMVVAPAGEDAAGWSESSRRRRMP